MTTIDDKLNHEINWRVGEISIVKSLPYLYPLSESQRNVLIKYAIPIFYSLWEGFVTESFDIYAKEINSLQIQGNNICLQLLTHAIDTKFLLQNPRTDFEKKIQLVDEIRKSFDQVFELDTRVSTESNVNYKVINRILSRFNLNTLPEEPYKDGLDTLLFFRNKLSHGESTLVVNQEKINEMSQIVISSIHILTERIITGYYEKTYLK